MRELKQRQDETCDTRNLIHGPFSGWITGNTRSVVADRPNPDRKLTFIQRLKLMINQEIDFSVSQV